MILNIDYPPSNATAAQLQAWCVSLVDELTLAFSKLNDKNILSDSEKLVNWK